MYCRVNPLVVSVGVYFYLIAVGSLFADDKMPVANSVAGGTAAVSSEQSIRQALGGPTTIDFQGVPLNEVADYIGERHGVQLMFDRVALKEGGIDPTTALVTVAVKDISLRSALKMILAPLRLTSVIQDEVLLITTKAKADAIFETRLYDVRDLVVHDNDPGALPDFDSLTDAIRLTVNPQSWDKAGGQGSLAPFSSNGICALMVWQNGQGHEQIENLLEKLRRLQPRRVYNQ
jgi:hypothetical protein